jgi:hypothetical protein
VSRVHLLFSFSASSASAHQQLADRTSVFQSQVLLIAFLHYFSTIFVQKGFMHRNGFEGTQLLRAMPRCVFRGDDQKDTIAEMLKARRTVM